MEITYHNILLKILLILDFLHETQEYFFYLVLLETMILILLHTIVLQTRTLNWAHVLATHTTDWRFKNES